MVDTFIPPAEVSKNAQQALAVRRAKPASERGMTLVGLARANQLANREPVSLDIIKRMVAYFARHEVDKEGSTWSEQGKGWQAWMGWGGDEGRVWAESILKENSMETKSTENLTEHQQLMAAALIEITHQAGKFDKSTMGNGAHYAPAEANPFKADGLVCANCYFFQPLGQCAIVAGEIEYEAICKLWIIPEAELPRSEPSPEVVEIVAEEIPAEETYEDDSMKAKATVVMTKEQAQEIVQEYAQLHPDKASVVYESLEQDLMNGKTTKEELLSQSSKVAMTAAERDAMPDEDFAIPSSRNFPVDSPVAIRDAVSSWGRYQGPVSFETFKRNLIKIAMRKGPEYYAALPQSWQDELAAATKDLAAELLKRLR